MAAKHFISQSDGFNKNFGHVHRSSGMFYYRASKRTATTVTLWNHFKHKSNIEVAIVASVRDMSGNLLKREPLGFEHGDVINYSPVAAAPFEGSVEIEVFSAQNLKIPFTAIAAIYEAEKSASLVHAYGRIYSSHEIEEGRTVPVGREMGWTLRDTVHIRSFCIFHNGAGIKDAQTAVLRIRNSSGKNRTALIQLPALPAFSTVRLTPVAHIPDLPAFLGGREGTASLDFVVNGAFTRMLVGNETLNGDEIQVTHSNFNYADHESEALPGNIGEAFMFVPELGARARRVIVYPEISSGSYALAAQGERTDFTPGDLVIAPVTTGSITFTRSDGVLPARIVTGLIVDSDGGGLPAECSLNVLHAQKPDKRLSWGVCGSADRLRSSLVATALPAIKGDFPQGAVIEVRAYSAVTKGFLSATLGANDIGALSKGIDFDDLFSGLSQHLGGETGFYSVYSEYPGLFCYTLLRGPHGSLSLEHCF